MHVTIHKYTESNTAVVVELMFGKMFLTIIEHIKCVSSNNKIKIKYSAFDYLKPQIPKRMYIVIYIKCNILLIEHLKWLIHILYFPICFINTLNSKFTICYCNVNIPTNIPFRL